MTEHRDAEGEPAAGGSVEGRLRAGARWAIAIAVLAAFVAPVAAYVVSHQAWLLIGWTVALWLLMVGGTATELRRRRTAARLLRFVAFLLVSGAVVLPGAITGDLELLMASVTIAFFVAAAAGVVWALFQRLEPRPPDC